MNDPHLRDASEVGRRLGHDLYRFGRGIGRDRLPASVAEGIAHAASRKIPREPRDRFVGKWLQLRLNAFTRSRIVDEKVTPEFLRRIDVAECPISRVALTHGSLLESDWSVDRLNNDGGYACNNLAVMSVRANRAKGDLRFDAVMARSRLDTPSEGLAPVAWLRMASLMLGPCFAERAGQAPLIPLVAPVAPCALQPASQVIQFVFTRGVARLSGKNAVLRQFRPACRGEAARIGLERFAEAMHQGLKGAPRCWDAWLRPEVMGAFEAWRTAVDPVCWAAAGHIAMRISMSDRIASDRLANWHLADRGYLQ